MKKFITVCICFAMILSSFPITSFAENDIKNATHFSSNLEPEVYKIVENENGVPVIKMKDLPAFYSTKNSNLKEPISPRTPSTYKEYTLKYKYKKERKVELADHPGFGRVKKAVKQIEVSSNPSGSMSISLGYGPIAIAYTPKNNNGGLIYDNLFHKVCDSEVIIIGDVWKYVYEVKEFTGAGILIDTYEETKYLSNNTFLGFKGLERPFKGEIRHDG